MPSGSASGPDPGWVPVKGVTGELGAVVEGGAGAGGRPQRRCVVVDRI